MAKGSGNTRNVGPAQAAGGRAQPDDSGYRAAETSLRYSHDENVRFSVNDISRELNIDGITTSDLRTRGDFAFSSVQRNNNGKFNLGSGEYWFTENMTFKQAIDRAISEIKSGYRHNETIRDHYMVVEDEASGLWATIQATLSDNNRVRLVISRYKGL